MIIKYFLMELFCVWKFIYSSDAIDVMEAFVVSFYMQELNLDAQVNSLMTFWTIKNNKVFTRYFFKMSLLIIHECCKL